MLFNLSWEILCGGSCLELCWRGKLVDKSGIRLGGGHFLGQRFFFFQSDLQGTSPLSWHGASLIERRLMFKSFRSSAEITQLLIKSRLNMIYFWYYGLSARAIRASPQFSCQYSHSLNLCIITLWETILDNVTS